MRWVGIVLGSIVGVIFLAVWWLFCRLAPAKADTIIADLVQQSRDRRRKG